MTGNNLADYLTLGLLMFSIGAVGVIVRRNPVVIFMCIELMLNAVNLTFLAFARYMPSSAPASGREASFMSGQMMVIFVMAVAAAEVAVGLGIIMAIYRLRKDVDVDEMNLMSG
ncbi:MAG: NADH-quinone oxidoreductase subunit NuoK [Fimbriimonadaceae bacterium]|nr:NADH-quinone oxidoreductase subunit NuoK [Fimbriimonadaceae bacterium]